MIGKRLLFVKPLITIVVLLSMCIPTAQAQSINTLKWKKRVLLLMEPKGDLSLCKKQLLAFKGLDEEIRERDLILLCYNGKQLLDEKLEVTSYQLSSNPDPGFQGVLLLGKDGGVKLKEPFVIEPRTIFQLIDRMPMRKAEMRASGNN